MRASARPDAVVISNHASQASSVAVVRAVMITACRRRHASHAVRARPPRRRTSNPTHGQRPVAGDIAWRQGDREQHDPRNEADRGASQQHHEPSPSLIAHAQRRQLGIKRGETAAQGGSVCPRHLAQCLFTDHCRTSQRGTDRVLPWLPTIRPQARSVRPRPTPARPGRPARPSGPVMRESCRRPAHTGPRPAERCAGSPAQRSGSTVG